MARALNHTRALATHAHTLALATRAPSPLARAGAQDARRQLVLLQPSDRHVPMGEARWHVI
eukprot:1212049-Prymnesium_polylepis.1